MPFQEVYSRLQLTMNYGSIPRQHQIVVDDDDEWLQRVDHRQQHLRGWRMPVALGMAVLCLGLFVNLLFEEDSGAGRVAPFLSRTILAPLEGRSKQAEGDIPRFYKDQLIDHNKKTTKHNTYTNRYYQATEHFGGPGHPIFVVLGGEGPLDSGMLYPYVTEHLAKQFRAAVLQVEMRFYGTSQPVKWPPSIPDLQRLLTADQATKDLVRLVRHKQEKWKCSTDRSSTHYCPVITVGGSYPGFLSAMMRLAHPDVVDMAYASSAPLKLYDQTVDPNAYYDYVTKVTDAAFPGCAAAVKKALLDMSEALSDTMGMPARDQVAASMNICLDTIPHYIVTDAVMAQEVAMIVQCKFE
jgi:pimeloyl-ACP methyl ester carboxylesterase